MNLGYPKGHSIRVPSCIEKFFRPLRQSAVAIGHYLTPGISTSSTSVRLRPETVNALQGSLNIAGVKTLIQSRVDVCGVLRSSRVGHGHSEGDLLLPLLRTRLGSYTGAD